MAGTDTTLTLGTRSAILLIAWVQGLVAAFLLVRRARRRRVVADLLLAAILVICCGDMTSHLIGWAGAYDRWHDLSFFPFGSNFAIGPLVWFHTRSLTEGAFRLRRRDLRHAVPFVIEKAYYLFIWSHPLPWKDAFDDQWHVPVVVPILAVAGTVVTGSYLVAALRVFARYRAWVDRSQSDAGLRLEWLQRLLYVTCAGFAAGLAFNLVDAFARLDWGGWYAFNLIIAGLTYYLSVAGLVSVPDPAPVDAPAHDAPPEPAMEPPPRPGPDLADRTARVTRLMEDQRPWLDPQLTLSELARQLHTNPSALSATINEGFGQNFNDFVNGYRVRAVQERLAAGDGTRAGVLAIAYDSGFNAKSTFNRAFRKATGHSPTEFQGQLGARRPDPRPES